MARPKVDESARKDVRFTALFTRMEVKELLSQSELCGLSISEFIRKKSLEKKVAPITDLKVLSELRRLGGLIKYLFNKTGGLYQKKTYSLLTELHAAVIRIGQQREEG